jgi:hypothetical protein
LTSLFQVLRVAAALCFIGHGAFGIITKEGWLAYFAVAGIGREGGYFFMPLVGAMDILLGVSVLLRPTRAALLYMTLWALWTASLRPLAGQGIAEFLERAGNYGVPLAFLAGLAAFPRGGWFAELQPRTLGARELGRLAWVLRIATATLLLGHGLLAAGAKPLLVGHLAALGLGDGGASTRAVVMAQGWIEIALAAAVMAFPARPLLLLALAWKLGTELLFPLTGDYVWEFVERAGSYGAPLGLLIASRALLGDDARSGNVAGQHEMQGGAAVEVVVGRPQASAVGVRDRPADGQPQAEALALGGEERLEDPLEVALRDSGAAVAHADHHVILPPPGARHGQVLGTGGDVLHGVAPVQHQVQQHLL